MTLQDATLPPPTPPARPRRRAAAVAGVVGVAAVIGGGAWAWQVWSAQGPQPSEALPASTLAYVAVDLDPPGGQKVAAYNTLRRIPSLKKELGLDSKGDLREDAIASWAGDRAAMAVVPVDEPEVVAVVEVGDAAEAKKRLAEIKRDCGEDEFGYVVGERWALLAETDAIARQVSADAEGRTLAEDGDYQNLTGAAGDAGVMTAYVAPAAGKALLEAVDKDPFLAFTVIPSLLSVDPITSIIGFVSITSAFAGFDDEIVLDEEFEMPEVSPEEKRLNERMAKLDELTQAEQDALFEEMDAFYEEKFGDFEDLGEELEVEALEDEEFADEELVEEEFAELWFEDGEGPALPATMRQQLEDFSGLGGSIRFEDGSLELEVVADAFLGGYTDRYDGNEGVASIAALPADTAVAFGGGLADGWGTSAIVDGTTAFTFGFGGDSSEQEVLDAFEESTGLSVADLEDLGGDTVAFAAKAGFVDAFDEFAESEDWVRVPVAAKVTGDAEAVLAALDKISQSKDDPYFTSVRDGDDVVIGPDPAYLEELVDPERTLGDTDEFERAFADADEAAVAFFGDLGAGGWLEALAEGDLTEADVAALSNLAMTVTAEGDQQRMVLRLALD